MGSKHDSSMPAENTSVLFGHAREFNPSILALVLASLAITCVSMSFADFSTLHIRYDPDNVLSFAFLGIIPLCAAATLFGAVGGTAAGILLGASMSIHAFVAPANYCEYFFITPYTTIATFAVAGGLFGYLCMRTKTLARIGSWNRTLQILLSSVVAGVLARVMFVVANLAFELGSDLDESLRFLAPSIPGLALFALLDVAIFAITSIIVDRVYTLLSQRESRSMQDVFRTWLALGALTFFALVSACESTLLTTRAIQNALSAINGTLGHIQTQIERYNSDPSTIVDGFGQDENGTILILKDGIVVGSNDTQSPVGTTADELMGGGGEYTGTGVRDLEDLAELSEDVLVTSENESTTGDYSVVYLRCVESGNHYYLVSWPEEKVFEARRTTVLWTAMTNAIQLAIVYVIASILLKSIVSKRIDQTNESLALITKGNLDERVRQRDTREFASLSDGINTTVCALENAIAEEAMRNARDLATARAIQESAIPSTFPPFPNIDRFDIFASMDAAKEVGGDFYDFFLVDDHRLGFLIADVSGKGIPASLFMMAAKTELQNLMGQGKDLAQAIRKANEHLCARNQASMFVTVWAAVLDFATGELIYVNAGHNPPLLRSCGRWQWLKERSGLFLGSFEIAEYHSHTLQLKEKDLLLLYTDGVSEAFSAEEEEFGDERLMAFASNHSNLAPRELARALRTDIAAWGAGTEQSDDITIMCLEYGVAPRPAT